MKSKSLVLLSVTLMTACSSMIPESKIVDYKAAGKLPPLEIPPDLAAPSRDDRYAVPDVGKAKGGASFSTYSAERKGQSKTATGSDVLPDLGKVHMERAGTQRWIVVPMPADQVWPLVKEFWQETGLVVNEEKPEAGVMETDWAENRAKLPSDFIRNALGSVFDSLYSTAERDKFRTRIEPGSAPGSTEIYISHRGMYEVYVSEGKSETRWEPRQPDPDLEAEMLRRLMVKLGADDARAKSELAASKTAGQDKAKLSGRSADGSGQLEIQDSFDRAWRRVGLALDRVGFTVEDRDRSQGLYFVRYVPPESEMEPSKKDDKGFLSRLMFWQSDSSKTTVDSKYRILVKAAGSNTVVQVMTREGGVDTSASAQKILGLLFDQLK